ncbi:MAG: DUF1896 domain-containing protein [Dysgonamonadaceae bacterium]|jgi:hypothetical protein|nr:DUF1896 domain-containing protein [Dysgonamonadaceae bacterium]
MSQELSYFRLSLLSYLHDSHPGLVANDAFIATRGDAAAEAYSAAVKNGETHDRAGELADEVLYAGLLFSPYNTLVNVLCSEFSDEILPEMARLRALEIMPKIDEVFGKYNLLDDFDSTPEYDLFYTELTGAVQILLENGIQ